MDLLCVERARLAASDHLGGVLKSSQPVKNLSESLSDQGARRCVDNAFASMNTHEQLLAFLGMHLSRTRWALRRYKSPSIKV